MQDGLLVGPPAAELDLQELPKQRVVAVPLRRIVEGLQEDIRLFELDQALSRILPLRQRISQRPADAVDDRCPEHEAETFLVQ
jgi:hypothetical protein